ncbi:alpha/beta fold hydrolase [Paenibacillus taiwanensis]|uniref:alpha/beta fold hydrolase n=1 Tax=Paenibacillus taiwanensis TaxID=401638 RepID=UPI000402B451|nr:alpha/beta fold hydrolase [Paenibacillus taiwanensis]
MQYVSQVVHHGGTTIHYLDSQPESSSELSPLLICPGLSQTAEECVEYMKQLHSRRCVVLSFRGRGKSGTPETGYSLEHHVADIAAVVEHAGLDRFHLYAYSRGVSYAIAYAMQTPMTILSLAILDYPAVHKRMEQSWADAYINDYLIPFGRTTHIRAEAVYRIQQESVEVELQVPAHIRLLVMRGTLEGSLLDDTDLNRYLTSHPDAETVHFAHSAHDVEHTEAHLLYAALQRFLADSPSSSNPENHLV